ncbi:MAG: zinc-binding dehydrogenase [Elusimicrobiota bacterium]|jgi:threonine dehydrogenase-like Zn-dependent dehydrogenase|nr:zinc-binding dehydrogenase [Elusimicrobiota bacterium]
MKTKAVRLYGADDLRLEEFDLPPIKQDEILVKIITDSICMSTYKLLKQGKKHKRCPQDVDVNPIIIGHEFAGDIIEVGQKWKDEFKVGQKFTIQPAFNYKGSLASPGYSYRFCGGASQYAIIPQEAMETHCLIHYDGDAYFNASLAEPMSCIIGAYHAFYHTNKINYNHAMGVKPGGNVLILGGAGPMGLGSIEYPLTLEKEKRPKRIVVTDIDDARLQRAQLLISPQRAKEKDVELIYINSAKVENIDKKLLDISEAKGYDDVLVMTPIKEVCQLADRMLGFDGGLNFFAGPTDNQFRAEINLYNCHYTSAHIFGTTGGTTDDLKEALDLASRQKIHPAVMVSHIGGIDSIAQATAELTKVPGAKRLTYPQINLPLTAIADFEELGKKDKLFEQLYKACKEHNGLWNAQAEKILLSHFHVI